MPSLSTENLLSVYLNYEPLTEIKRNKILERLTYDVEEKLIRVSKIRKRIVTLTGAAVMGFSLYKFDAIDKIKSMADNDEELLESVYSNSTFEDNNGSDFENIHVTPTDVESESKSTTAVTIEVDEADLENFIINYRQAYMNALNYPSFNEVSSYLLEGSKAYVQIQDYIREISPLGDYFNFQSISADNFNRIGPSNYVIATTEHLLFEESNGTKTQYERQKEYNVRLLSSSTFKIEGIKILRTDKSRVASSSVSAVETKKQKKVEKQNTAEQVTTTTNKNKTEENLKITKKPSIVETSEAHHGKFVQDYYVAYVKALNERNPERISSFMRMDTNDWQSISDGIANLSEDTSYTLLASNIESKEMMSEDYYEVTVYVEIEERDSTGVHIDHYDSLMYIIEESGQFYIRDMVVSH
ncbi:hypothetical protein CSV69_03740 [Sporosarcina sp. P26b]|nr:hypothetical protein CSV69_03740 [Sporosarcina sp. P26b]